MDFETWIVTISYQISIVYTQFNYKTYQRLQPRCCWYILWKKRNKSYFYTYVVEKSNAYYCQIENLEALIILWLLWYKRDWLNGRPSNFKLKEIWAILILFCLSCPKNASDHIANHINFEFSREACYHSPLKAHVP